MQLSPQASTTSSQAYRADDRNAQVQVYLNGDFVPRSEAKVSVFDAGYVCGDGVWEGVRLVNGRVISFDAHIDRLFEGANAIAMDIGLTKQQVKDVILRTFEVNGMHDGAHARLMVTRGLKKTPNQDPRFIIGSATVVCVAEHKVVDTAAKKRGLALHTSTIRCSTPDVFDLRLNSHSRLNFIQALIQAIHVGADEALMLDTNGFVSSCNSTNFFVVRGGALWTSSGRYCFNGITRATVLRLARENGIPVHEGDYTLAEVYAADEAFVTGTLGGLTPVAAIDGRRLPTEGFGPLTQRLADLYQAYITAPAA
ncbi:aminotransferase class IV [Pseudacidovorax intermedius]|uniref:branched-chain-amino-acid transaminase n=1 Tax=Pseudacidovorax intermedius TaxID=433924 RepID=A0A147GLQ5_9BURK|nr:aminotransferase class IV [Pseudacidovorax intermedius]KTT11801.1 aminotransferase class IV [Pseudacidovorax intermedius]